jgi:DNA-directed RNA polymerase specialized sigma24 family protein
MHTRTTTQLIEGLRDPANRDAWSGFDARYRPVLIAFARKIGFSTDDAAELAQQTLSEFARAYLEGKYKRDQGRLSSWLLGIARNVGLSMRRKRCLNREGGDSRVAEFPDDDTASSIWELARQRTILAEAIERLYATSRADAATLRAFELFALRGVPAEEAAAQCEIGVDSVYLAKNRLTKRLREIVASITAAYDEGE